MLEENKCRHFNGISNEVCKAGVAYRGLRTDGSLPCLPAGVHLPCEEREYPTIEEAAADKERRDREVGAFLTQLVAFETRQNEDCPHCRRRVDQLRQVGRCVYASPCGCRLWQGKVPEAWRNK